MSEWQKCQEFGDVADQRESGKWIGMTGLGGMEIFFRFVNGFLGGAMRCKELGVI